MIAEFQEITKAYTQQVQKLAAKETLDGPPARMVYTKKQAAEVAGGVSIATIERAINSKQLKCYYVGRRPVIEAEELRRWIFEKGGKTK
jgi:hypothetical protein